MRDRQHQANGDNRDTPSGSEGVGKAEIDFQSSLRSSAWVQPEASRNEPSSRVVKGLTNPLLVKHSILTQPIDVTGNRKQWAAMNTEKENIMTLLHEARRERLGAQPYRSNTKLENQRKRLEARGVNLSNNRKLQSKFGNSYYNVPSEELDSAVDRATWKP